MSLAEVDQLHVGNSLLLKGLWLCIPTALHGGAVILEHPAPAYDIEKPSIWRTGIVRLLLRDGWLFRRTTFRQGHFGSAGAKPTTLLYANTNIPQLLNDLAQPMGEVSELIGKDNKGCFKTMQAKEYPPALCSCFAQSFWSSIASRSLRTTSDEVDGWISQLATAAARVDPDRLLLPDYQPRR